MKKLTIFLLFAFFLAFLVYELPKNADFQVLSINSPTEIIVDINKNGLKDDNETILLENIQSFSTKPAKNNPELLKRLKISQEDAIGLGFLAENFAKENLADKKVKLEDKNSKIIIDGKNYEDLLLNQGLAVKKNEEPSAQLKKNLDKVRKLHLIIFNNKSHKYHKLTCKYGLLAHNSQILPISQVTKDAKPCKFCFGKHNKYKKNSKKFKSKKFSAYYDVIPNIKSPSTVFQSGPIKIFLTDFTRVLKPSNTCNTAVCQALVNEINSAQGSIDFAIYGYTKIPALQNALLKAQQRGVKIRFVYDLDGKKNNIYPDTIYLSKILTNNQADYSAPIMHDKFFIFDRKTVLTGSANISNTDMSGFNSNVVILVNSTKIADIYSREFEQMYNGNFHKKKSKIKNTKEKINETDFSVYFSPKDKAITTQVIPLIDNAHKYIYIPAFLITHKSLTESLINASKRGVAVKIILDATNTHDAHSKLKTLRQNGIQVKTENFAGKLHSKSIIIDDTYTIIGSMNFSRSGESVNDENMLIIKNRDITLFYKTFFQYLWQRIPDKWLKLNARSESYDSVGSCNDGIDNDFDGKIDKADDSCRPSTLFKKKVTKKLIKY